MANKMDARMIQKRSTVSGVVPTVPSSNDHTDGTWIATDIYKGELFLNLADGAIWSRDDSGIYLLGGSGGFKLPYETTTNIPTGIAGVTVTIPSATVVGSVFDVAVWDGDIRIYPTIVKGTSGADQTVKIISSKAYTGATVYVTLK